MPGLAPGGSRRKSARSADKQYPGRGPDVQRFFGRLHACGPWREASAGRPVAGGVSGSARRGTRPVVVVGPSKPDLGWERKPLPSKAFRALPPSFPPWDFQVGAWVGAENLTQQGFPGIPTLPTLKSRCTREKTFSSGAGDASAPAAAKNFVVHLWSRVFRVGGVGGRPNPCPARLSAPTSPPTLFFLGGRGGRTDLAGRFANPETGRVPRQATRWRPWPSAMGLAWTQKSQASRGLHGEMVAVSPARLPDSPTSRLRERLRRSLA